MTNLEKFTAGEVAARNNGTLEQLETVVKHCFPTDLATTSGYYEFYFAYRTNVKKWDCAKTTDLPTIDITQLWEELQAMKKPEIWHIKVTYQNNKEVSNWIGAKLIDDGNVIAGMFKNNEGSHKGTYYSKWLSDEGSLNFGNEIDFATFLKYTGVEVEPKPTNEIVLPEKWGGEIEGLPAPILKRMMECQVEQGNKADHTVFEDRDSATKSRKGFDWDESKEGAFFWLEIITNKQYSKFFGMYPENKPSKVEKSLEEKIEMIYELNDERVDLLLKRDTIDTKLTEINTQISALLK